MLNKGHHTLLLTFGYLEDTCPLHFLNNSFLPGVQEQIYHYWQ